ncbi:hypothetical protein MSAN_02376800 [Mycena sanguinolenta]|uniref:Protein kinase domain-containing protein n=1 Tax=Mycena sanguinolenta TaxID=230812 RepID=A0A8H6X5D0_9AGAR|nr:hypothetical protein MSAN_02376800 [Mycena sanguinolenta]
MDPPANSNKEFIVVSTSDYTESSSALFPQIARTHIQEYLETTGRQIADRRSVINYNYYITGGFGGSGGEGLEHGGTIRISENPNRRLEAGQGSGGAEEKWRQHVAKYESIRHPHIMQLYGLVNTKGLYAMVFHDELIPYNQFFRRFEHSPILTAYIIGYCTPQFWEATNYISDVSLKPSIYDDNPRVISGSSRGTLAVVRAG